MRNGVGQLEAHNEESVAIIPLYWRGEIVGRTIVDLAEYAALAQFKWSLHPNGYAVRYGRRDDGRRYALGMHRAILGLKPGERALQGDHINGDRLDNRRSNLRVVTAAQNAQNRPGRGRSATKNVYLRHDGKWEVRVSLGSYDTEAEAVAVAQSWHQTQQPFSRTA